MGKVWHISFSAKILVELELDSYTTYLTHRRQNARIFAAFNHRPETLKSSDYFSTHFHFARNDRIPTSGRRN